MRLVELGSEAGRLRDRAPAAPTLVVCGCGCCWLGWLAWLGFLWAESSGFIPKGMQGAELKGRQETGKGKLKVREWQADRRTARRGGEQTSQVVSRRG